MSFRPPGRLYREPDTGAWVGPECEICDRLLDEDGRCVACDPVLGRGDPPRVYRTRTFDDDPWGSAPHNPIGEQEDGTT